MTPNEITTAIAGRMGKELDLQYRQWLMPHVNTWRSRLIRNTLEKHPAERSQFQQTIYIPLTYGQFNCGQLQCMGSYSEPLPALLRIGSNPFDYLGGTDNNSPFRYTDPGTGIYLLEGKTAKHFTGYIMANGRLIVPGRNLKGVRGVGIFDDPVKAMEWQCKTESTGCDWWNSEYPVSGDVLAMIKTAIWNELGAPKEILPENKDQHE